MAARKGEGTKYFDEKKQLWRAMLTTPAGKRITKASKNEEVVNDWLNEQRLLIGRNQHIEPNSVKVSEWILAWLETYARTKLKPRTYDSYIGRAKHAAPLYDTYLTKVTPDAIQRVYNGMLDEGYSAQTVTHLHNLLKGCFRQAVLNGLIYRNPVDSLKAPKIQRTEIEIFTADEIKKIFKAAENYRNPVIVKIAYSSGLRLSEVLALRWEDVDIKKCTISVNQTVHSSTTKGIYFSDTKNTSSCRTISMLPEVITAITEHKLKEGIKGGILFHNSRKGFETPSYYLRRVFSLIQEETGIKKGFHSFRHTHASELLSAGIPVQDVSKRLGHSKVSTTLNTYAHCLPTAEQRIMSTMKKLMKNK